MKMKTFKEVWAEKEAEGYRYGSDALDQVEFGWDLAMSTIIKAATSVLIDKQIDNEPKLATLTDLERELTLMRSTLANRKLFDAYGDDVPEHVIVAVNVVDLDISQLESSIRLAMHAIKRTYNSPPACKICKVEEGVGWYPSGGHLCVRCLDDSGGATT